MPVKPYEDRIKESAELVEAKEYDKAIYQLDKAIENFPEEAKSDDLEGEIERIKGLMPKDFKPSEMVEFELYHSINYKDGQIGPGVVKMPYEMKVVFESESMKRIGKCLV